MRQSTGRSCPQTARGSACRSGGVLPAFSSARALLPRTRCEVAAPDRRLYARREVDSNGRGLRFPHCGAVIQKGATERGFPLASRSICHRPMASSAWSCASSATTKVWRSATSRLVFGISRGTQTRRLSMKSRIGGSTAGRSREPDGSGQCSASPGGCVRATRKLPNWMSVAARL